jgi:acetolactate synthase-1/2/3 large subunit
MDQEFPSLTKADLVAQFLADVKTPAVFELSGGMIAFLTDAIVRLGKTPVINTRHEQAAGFAAEGATRISGHSCVAMGTSGPGATNLITAVASSYFDSVPTIFITGQVNQRELKQSSVQRQNGFQEFDIVNAVDGITKYSVRITSETDILGELKECWTLANEGRPGPVLIDIPIDVQQELTLDNPNFGFEPTQILGKFDNYEKAHELLELIKASKQPVVLLGGGIRTSQSVDLIRKLVGKWKLPVLHSLMAVDVLDTTSPYRIGMIGSYGNRWANRAVARADLIIAFGTRLDVRQTGSDPLSFTKGKKIFRVDVDIAEIQGRISADVSVLSHLNDFLLTMEQIEIDLDFSDWLRSIYSEAAAMPQKLEQSVDVEFNPNELMSWISSVNGQSNGYVVDVGQHQMWAAQSIEIQSHQRFITSGGLGAMGFALPAAIGAAIVQPGRWVVIAGDGCTQLSLPELQTIKQHNLPITVCIINNHQHGMVAQFQEANLGGRYFATRDGYSAPDFCELATAFGIKSLKLQNLRDLSKAHELLSNWNTGPLVLEFIVSSEAKALPKMDSRNGLNDL